jgi:hypothetical protein
MCHYRFFQSQGGSIYLIRGISFTAKYNVSAFLPWALSPAPPPSSGRGKIDKIRHGLSGYGSKKGGGEAAKEVIS